MPHPTPHAGTAVVTLFAAVHLIALALTEAYALVVPAAVAYAAAYAIARLDRSREATPAVPLEEVR